MFTSAKYFIFLVFLGLPHLLISEITDTIDFTHLSLQIELITKEKKVEGQVLLNFDYHKASDSVFLNGIKMTYKKVLLNGKKVDYRYDNKGIWIPLTSAQTGSTNSIEIEYECYPRKGLYFIGWENDESISKQQIWTQGQGIDHRHWIPHRDDQTDKLTTEIRLEFDANYQVVSNGDLIDYKSGRKKSFWHFKMAKPHSSYLIMLAIGKYDKRETQSKSGIPLSQYYYPERRGDYKYYYYGNEKIFNFLENHIGVDYPWSSYSQVPVQDFRHGGMENTTATIFGDFFLVDSLAFPDRNYSYVNAHELAHQWFGNMVTASESKHHWLHEGFATYYQWLSEEMLYGKDYFDWNRHEEGELALLASQMDTIPLGHPKAGSYRFYQKGAWVLYMLHQNLGDELFKKVIRHYLNNNAYQIVTTESLNASIIAVTGQSAESYFDRWVFSYGEPDIKVEGRIANDTLKFTISPGKSAKANFNDYNMPVKVFFEDGTKETSFIGVGNEVHEEGMLFKKSKTIKYWIVNPNQSILAHVEDLKDYTFLKSQYQASENVLDRYFAVQAMMKDSLALKKDFLVQVAGDENEFYAIRAEALKQLSLALDDKERYELFKMAFSSSDVQFQKESLKYLPRKGSKYKDLVRPLVDGASYELRRDALALSIDMERLSKNKWIMDKDFSKNPGFPGRNVEIEALLYQVYLFKSMAALDQLKTRTSGQYDFLTRMNAFEKLQLMKYIDEDLIPHYFTALFDYNWKLVKTSREALQAYYKDPVKKIMIDQYIKKNKGNWSDFQKRVVSRTFELNLD